MGHIFFMTAILSVIITPKLIAVFTVKSRRYLKVVNNTLVVVMMS